MNDPSNFKRLASQVLKLDPLKDLRSSIILRAKSAFFSNNSSNNGIAYPKFAGIANFLSFAPLDN